MLEQKKMIGLFKNKGLEDDRIDSMLMYGSFTQNAGDEFSDIEFYLFVEDKEYPQLKTKEWLASVYPIYTHFFNEYGTEVVIFKNLIRGEFHFLPCSRMDVVDSFATVGYFPNVDQMCLVDKKGHLSKALQVLEETVVERETPETVTFVVNNFINAWLFGVNVWKRGEFARSLECLSFCQKYHLQLIRLLEHTTDHWVNPFKNVEQEISTSAYRNYQQMTSALEPTAILAAYKILLADHRKNVNSFKEYVNSELNELLDQLEDYIR